MYCFHSVGLDRWDGERLLSYELGSFHKPLSKFLGPWPVSGLVWVGCGCVWSGWWVCGCVGRWGVVCWWCGSFFIAVFLPFSHFFRLFSPFSHFFTVCSLSYFFPFSLFSSSVSFSIFFYFFPFSPFRVGRGSIILFSAMVFDSRRRKFWY
jgi:hypothetical protein